VQHAQGELGWFACQLLLTEMHFWHLEGEQHPYAPHALLQILPNVALLVFLALLAAIGGADCQDVHPGGLVEQLAVTPPVQERSDVDPKGMECINCHKWCKKHWKHKLMPIDCFMLLTAALRSPQQVYVRLQFKPAAWMWILETGALLIA
jgi:hypothetical protein